MDENRRAKFEALLEETRGEILQIDGRIEQELEEVKERIANLNTEKQAQLTIYGGYCQLLGIPNDLDDHEEGSES